MSLLSQAVASLCLALPMFALPAAEQAPEAPEFAQRLGAQLPLRTVLRDVQGRAVRLGDYFGGAPVLLVLGYYRCRNLCSLVYDDALQAALQSGASKYRLVGVSIDPTEGPREAAPRQSALRNAMGRDGERLTLLTGDMGAVAAVARAAGFGYRYNAAQGLYEHPAGFVLVTPEGRISRYFLGLHYQGKALRDALARAQGGATGELVEQVRLLCARLDPATGHGGAALLAVRGAALAAAVAVAMLGWRLGRGRTQ